MHMSDALLSPSVGASFWAASAGAVAYCARRAGKSLDEGLLPMTGVMSAFVFAAQMINFAIPGTGSSGHLGGGLLLAAVLGPSAGFLAAAAVLTVQAFFFADGGLLALGSNIWNLGVYPCFIAYPFIYKPLAGDGSSSKRTIFASLAASVASLQLGSLSVVLQTYLSGRSELPFWTFLLFMQPLHLAIGVVEGVVTAGIIGYIRRERPEIFAQTSSARSLVSSRRLLAAFFAAALLLGGIVSWYASEDPDGLEWSIERTARAPELPEQTDAIYGMSKRLQEAVSILPGYGFKKDEADSHKEALNYGTPVAGIAGSLITLAVVAALGMGIRALKRKR